MRERNCEKWEAGARTAETWLTLELDKSSGLEGDCLVHGSFDV